jgi:glycosyltransferase involved in cell wall biosynthesis
MTDPGAAGLDSDERRTIAVFRSPVFNPSEGFVQAQAAGLVRFRPVVVGIERKGPIHPALASRLILPETPFERLRLTLWGDPSPFLRRLCKEAPLLIHAHFATDGLLALPIAKALGIPLITTLRGYDVTRTRRRLLLSGRASWVRYALLRHRLIEHGALFLAVSDALRERAIADGFPAERIITHYNGVDLDRLRPGGPEGKVLLHVGRLVEKKGTAMLIRAFAEVARAHAEARLVIVGDGPLRAKLEREVRQNGLADAVRFTGALPHSEVVRWMQRAWALACPSLTARDGDAEGLPNTVVEAAACGLPVVASRHSGIPEAVVDGETGLLVAEGDTAALAVQLTRILGEPQRRDAMASASRQLAETTFDLRRQIALLERLYDEFG